MADLKITDLTETTDAPDSSYIPIDDGTTTYKITVGNYNSEANATAKSYAEAAQGYAGDASDAKDLAVGAKNDAQLAVSSASDYADAASLSADAASGSATEASGYVGQAQTAASNASASALAAAASAQGVEDYATLSKSWAEGNTGVRPDESVNNAKYWAGVAQGAAGGGVTTFNGRSGVVVPQAHDYNAGQVDYDNTPSGLSATDVKSAIDEIQGEINGLGTAADKDSTNAVTQSSTDLVESGAVYTELATKADSSKAYQTDDTTETALDLADYVPFYDSSANAKKKILTSDFIRSVVPVGTVINFFGESVPEGYLICDGSTYNKADYVELSNLLLSLTTHGQYEVSGDNTKFKVPDLRGELLRGTGTNSHTFSSGSETVTCGNGANVGVHQNPTLIPNFQANSIGNSFLSGYKSNTAYPRSENRDSEIKGIADVANNRAAVNATLGQDPNALVIEYAARPTNTSVLYCIKY